VRRPAAGAGRVLIALLGACLAGSCSTARPGPAPAVAVERVETEGGETARLLAGSEARPGLIELHVDRAHGRVLALLPSPSGPRGRIGEYLYVEGIATGLGSNPVGLDRGQEGESQVVELRRVGSRILLEAENLRFRALGADPAAEAAVRESFATSVLWGTDLLGEDAAGRLLLDLTGFLLQDPHGVAARLAAAGQGSFSLDRDRSAVDLDACLAFPRNDEFQSLLTFSGNSPGPEVRAVAPDPQAVTLVLHQSLVALPEPGYRPREYDPRMGSLSIGYTAPLDRPVERRWILRHRLEKVDPSAASSPVREPIVYYVDLAAPEPVRSALIEGASWWSEAFAAAGFENAFRVEPLPEGVDPLDVRYNVVQWVHRATRGWSYGGAVVDPRTGEILQGHVTLGSLRIRQDRLLFEGLAGVAATGSGAPDDPVELALARIRQLAAHEVGHTLGLAHNFAGSALGRASVMDYPAPLVTVNDAGGLDFSHAYATGVGAWDRAAIRWAYSEFPPEADEGAELDRIVRETLAGGLLFLSDADARPAGAAQPLASLWDNGADPVAALARTMRVRRIAMARFGERNVAIGGSLARLEEVFATVYFHHRYQLAAAAKVLGGLDYRHAVRGDGEPPARPVAAERQRQALAALLDTLAPAVLDIPEEVLRLLLPRPPELARNREQFASRTRPAFDALGAAATAADLSLRALLDPDRAARLVDFHRRDPAQPDFSEVLDTLIERVFADAPELDARQAEIARVVQRVAVDRLIELSGDESAAPWVRARVDSSLADLLQRIDKFVPLDAAERAHDSALTAEIGRHLARPAPAQATAPAALDAPPGDPIGDRSEPLPAGLADCGFEAPER
jgi:Met-zincin/Domain of unknown function (DUF5117)